MCAYVSLQRVCVCIEEKRWMALYHHPLTEGTAQRGRELVHVNVYVCVCVRFAQTASALFLLLKR